MFEFKDGKSLSKEELLKVATLDHSIPIQWDPFFDIEVNKIEDRLTFYDKLTEHDFFKVVYSDAAIVAIHIVRDMHKTWGSIATLWVHLDLRKTGLAKRLKQDGEAWARSRGLLYIQTSVNSANTRMLELNRKNGFEEFSVTFRKKL